MKRAVILYSFYSNIDNANFFLKHTLLKSDLYDFIFINSNESLEIKISDKFSNCVKIFNRKNIGRDFGAWADAIHNMDLANSYEYFIFLNDTSRGPFIPSGVNIMWPEIFINNLINDVKLFGPSINQLKDNTHVQTYAFATDRFGLSILINNNIFPSNLDIMNKYNFDDINDKVKFIEDFEIHASKVIIESGYNIGCMLYSYKNIDWRMTKNVVYNEIQHNGETDHVWSDGCYYGTTPSIFELCFTKYHRNFNVYNHQLYSFFMDKNNLL